MKAKTIFWLSPSEIWCVVCPHAVSKRWKFTLLLSLGGEAAKHFLSGNYIKDPREKERAFGKTSASSDHHSSTTSHSHGANYNSSANHGHSHRESLNRGGHSASSSSRTTSKTTTQSAKSAIDNLTLNSLDPERIRRFVLWNEILA